MTLPVDLFIISEGKIINLRSARDLNLETSYDLHGDNLANFQICDWGGKLPDPRSLVYLRDPANGVFWTGYAGQVQEGGFFGGASKVVARGWQHSIPDHGWNEHKIWTAGTPLQNLINEAMGKCSHIGNNIPYPGGLTSTQLAEDSNDYIQQTPDNVFDFVKDIFGYLGTPLIWQVRQPYDPAFKFSISPNMDIHFTDTAPRYFVTLTKEDKFEPTYDSDIVYNFGSLQWGDGRIQTELPAPADLYSVIPDIREKRVNANNDVASQTYANHLARFLVSRNNVLRPINSTLEISCNTKIRAVFNAVPTPTNNVPHWLVRSHFMIRVLNDMSKWGKYKVRDFYIVDAKYDWRDDQQKLTLTLGDPVFYDAFRLMRSYDSNRAFTAAASGILNEPLRNADELPTYGPQASGSLPQTTGAGLPVYQLNDDFLATNGNALYLPYKAAVDPNTIADYGVQVNFGREADSIGIKGYIRVIPCKILNWTLDFIPGPGSDTIPTGTLSVQLYGTYPFTAGTAILDTIQITTGSGGTGTFSTPRIFTQGGKIGVRVSAIGPTGAGFQVGLGGQKLFPDVGRAT